MAEVLHDRLANTAAFYSLAMAGWAGLFAVRGRGVDGGYLGAAVIGEGLLVTQALLGVFLVLGGQAGALERPGLHVLYGVMAALVWPGLFTVTRRRPGRREAVLFAAGALFLWGLVLRAAATGAVR